MCKQKVRSTRTRGICIGLIKANSQSQKDKLVALFLGMWREICVELSPVSDHVSPA